MILDNVIEGIDHFLALEEIDDYLDRFTGSDVGELMLALKQWRKEIVDAREMLKSMKDMILESQEYIRSTTELKKEILNKGI